jgi:hypothetical protein
VGSAAAARPEVLTSPAMPTIVYQGLLGPPVRIRWPIGLSRGK